LFKRANLFERVLLIAGGLSLVYPTAMDDAIGFGLFGVIILSQNVLRKESTAKTENK
jgi:TRAP-type uncharacterized transport system fused permease subunit